EPEPTIPGEPPEPPGIPHPPKPRWRTFLTTLFKLAIVGGLIFWLRRSNAIDVDKILEAVRKPSWWASAVPLATLAVLVVSFRWWLLLLAEGIEIPLGAAVRLGLIGHFWNMFLPGAVTGDLAKMYYVGPYAPGRRAEAYTTIVLDRLIGLAALAA